MEQEIGFCLSGMEVIVDGSENCFGGTVEHEAYQSMLRRKWWPGVRKGYREGSQLGQEI